jgi:hypothetical protein
MKTVQNYQVVIQYCYLLFEIFIKLNNFKQTDKRHESEIYNVKNIRNFHQESALTIIIISNILNIS